MAIDKKELAKAKSWCEKARDILKLKKTGFFVDTKKDSVHSKALEKAMKHIELSLPKLKGDKSPQYEKLAQEYIDLSKVAAEAVSEGNKQKAKLLTDDLMFLDLKIQQARGKLPPGTDLEAEKVKQQELQRAECEKAMKVALEKKTELTGYTDGTHKFTGKVPGLIAKAKEQMDQGGYRSALIDLGKVPAEVQAQLALRVMYSDYLRKVAEVKEQVRELAIVDKVNNQSSSRPVRDVLDEALQLATAFAYSAALSKLGEAQKAYDKSVKSLPKEDKEKVKAYSKAKAHFEERFSEEKDRINQAGTIRGALESPVKEHLEGARADLKTARITCDNAKSADALKVAEKMLDGIEQKIKDAIKASELTKTESNTDLKSQKAWLSMLRQAENAQEQVKAFRGSEPEQKKMRALVLKATDLIKTKGAFTTGYGEALKVLEEYSDILKEAQDKHESIMTLDLPDLIKRAAERICVTTRSYALIAPAFMASIQWDEIARLGGEFRTEYQKAADENAKDLVVQKWLPVLNKFEQELSTERNKLFDEKQSAGKKIESFHAELKKLRVDEVPEGMLAESVRTVRIAEETDIEDFEWARAEAKVTRAMEALKSISEYFDKYASDWAEKRKKLEEYKVLALKLMKWPPTSINANSLMDSIRAINDLFSRTYDYEACLKAYADEGIDKYGPELKQLENSVPPEKDVDSIRDALRLANIAVQNAVSAVRTKKLWALERKLEGVADPTKTAYHTALEKLNTSWFGFMGKPIPPSAPGVAAGAPDGKLIEKQRDEHIKTAEAIGKKIDEALKDKEKLAGVVTDLKRTEEQKNDGRMAEHVKDLIDQLHQMGGVIGQLLDEWELIAGGQPGRIGEEQKKALLKSLREKVVKAMDQRRGEIEKRKELATKYADELGESLTNLKHEYRNFKGYTAELEKRLADSREMIESGDPDLILLAKKNMGEIAQKISEIDPENLDENSIRYSDVESKWKELSVLIGTKETRGGSITLENRMPNTYRRLNDELVSMIVEAKKTSPALGLAMLEKLEKPIAEAVHQAQLLNDEHEVFKEKKRLIEFRWADIKKETKTRVTERTKAFEQLLETRLAEADGARHAENGLPAAYKLLNAVGQMLNEVTLAPDPRAKLMELDAACAQEQRNIRDWARQFEVDKSDFTKRIIGEAKAKVEKNFEEGKINLADRDDGLKMLESFEDVASAAGKVVKPYMANIEKLPHKRSGANLAPDPKKAEADFARARNMLADATKSVTRIAESTTTTNVNLTGDFKRVQKHWADQVRNFATAVQAAADSMPNKIKELVDNGDITGDPIEAAKANALKAKEIVAEMAGRFRADAFAGPFEILMKLTPSDSKAKEKLAKEKKAAREEVLRIMRQCRTDLLNHPVLTKLTEKGNPFDGPKLMAASGYVRASLKRVEIETLIGV